MVSSSCVENVSAIAQAGLSDSIPPSPLGSLPLPDMLALIVRVKSTYPQLYQLLSNTNILNAQILNDRDIGRRNGSELYSRPPLNPDMGAGPGGGTGAGARAELLSLAAQDTVEPPGIMQAGARNLWIVKPAYLSRARGIEVFDNMSEIFDYVQVEPKTVYVVQKYMGRAHLLAKRKYDIRLWVLMSSHTPLYLFLYNDSYFRVSSSLYDMRNISSGIHITNLILQEKSTEYDGSWQHEIGAGATSNSFNISTFLKNLARLDREQQKGRKEVVVPNTMIIGGGSGGGNDNSNIKSIKNSGKTKKLTPLQRRIEREKQEDSEEYDNNVDTFGFIDPVYPPFSYMERWKTVTLPEIRKIVVATMKAGRAGYSVGKTTYWFRDRKKSFEFFGFDIMFDVDFHPWLIEVNMGPSLEHRNPIMSPLIVTVIEDMVKIAVDNQIYSQSDSLALIERLIASTPKSLSFSDRSSSTSSSTSSSPSSSSKLPWFRSWSSKRSDSSASSFSSSSSSTPSSSSSPTFFASASSFLSSPFFGADKDEMVADFNRLHVNTGGWNLVFREKMFSDSDDVTTTEEPFDL